MSKKSRARTHLLGNSEKKYYLCVLYFKFQLHMRLSLERPHEKQVEKMNEFTIRTHVKSYQENELPEEYRSLVEAAKQNIFHSYSPYSEFKVSAAVRLEDGTVLQGTNQENCAYPSGLCAERTTLFYAHSQHPDKAVTAIAIACYTHGAFTPNPGSPCGACRQVMVEFEHIAKRPMAVILYGSEETYVFDSAADLLPLVFVPESLNDGVKA